MVRITYDNFRQVDCKFIKYVSQKRGKFKINILTFRDFRDKLIAKYSEEEIQRFFRMFPYDLDSEVRPEDMILSIKLEIEFYDDLHLVSLDGLDFVLIDQSTEQLEGLDFLKEVRSQPIILREFVVVSLLDFVRISQEDLFYSIELNLRGRESEETKYVEASIKDGIYI